MRGDALALADHPNGIADHVGVALFEAQGPCRIEPGVHARQHRHLGARRHRQVCLVERLGLALVVGEQGLGSAHALSFGWRGFWLLAQAAPAHARRPGRSPMSDCLVSWRTMPAASGSPVNSDDMTALTCFHSMWGGMGGTSGLARASI